MFPKGEIDKLRKELKEIDLNQIVQRIHRLSSDRRLNVRQAFVNTRRMFLESSDTGCYSGEPA